MSSRSLNTEALVLSVSPFADDHRNVLLLTPQELGCALVPATLFGGARSKLRGMVAAYQSGRIWLYSNPIKNSNKITDFSVSSYRMELRESLVRSWCAAVCSEVTIKTCGTVEWRLVNAFLDGLCVSDDEGCKRGLLRFLWRLLRLSGIAPDIFRCGSCSAALAAATSAGVDTSDDITNAELNGATQNGTEAAAVYSPAEDACFCTSCRCYDDAPFQISVEALRYLHAVTEKAPGYSRHLPLSPAAYGALKRFLFFLTEKMIGGQLNTFQAGYI